MHFSKDYTTKESYIAMLGKYQDYLICNAYVIEQEAKAGVKEARALVDAINGSFNGTLSFESVVNALQAYQTWKGIEA